MQLPAFCDNCGYVVPSVIEMGLPGQVTVVTAEQSCPNCGAVASVPSGTYKLADDVIEVINASRIDVAKLRVLVEVLQRAHARQDAPETVAEEIEKKVPELSALGFILRKSPAAKKLMWRLLPVIVAAIIQQKCSPARIEINNQIIIEQSIEQIYRQPPPSPPPRKPSGFDRA